MPSIAQLEEEREYFMFALTVAGDDSRRAFLEECLRNNAKRLEQLRNELPNG